MCGVPLPPERPELQAAQMHSLAVRWVLRVLPDLEKVMDSLGALPTAPCREGLPLVEPWRTVGSDGGL